MNNISNITNFTDRIFPITLVRRNFGAIEKDLRKLGVIIITKNGKPCMEIKTVDKSTATPTAERLRKFAGVLQNTIFNDEKTVEEILKKKSRKRLIYV